MIAFGTGSSAAGTAAAAAREAATAALMRMKGQLPLLAMVFVSPSYPDAEAAARSVREVVGDAQIIGGTSGGCVLDGSGITRVGVSVVLLGGPDLEVQSRTAPLDPPSFMTAVPVAERIAAAADGAAGRGFAHFSCLVLAPGSGLDGDAFVAAIRKGAGAHAQLAGGFTSDDLTMDCAKVFFGDELRDDCVVLTGLFTRSPVGIVARHGGSAVGPLRTVTRSDDGWLVQLDDRPALDVWLADVRDAGGDPPADRTELARYLATHYELGLADRAPARDAAASSSRELVARAPFRIRDDGAVHMSASVAEGTPVRVIHATRADLLRASGEAAATAKQRAGGGPVAGALVLACTARLTVLGESFAQEPVGIAQVLDAPVGGACVYGEIARNLRDADAFFNSTVVVVVFA